MKRQAPNFAGCVTFLLALVFLAAQRPSPDLHLHSAPSKKPSPLFTCTSLLSTLTLLWCSVSLLGEEAQSCFACRDGFEGG